MYTLIRNLLFTLDPERAHHLSFFAIKLLELSGITRLIRVFFVPKGPELHRQVMGLRFESPIGLAAGFDKNAERYNAFADFGFGFVEVGTVTPKAQPGNPKKRLFRLTADRALINRMGFNNGGLIVMIEKLKARKTDLIIGGNIGKNKNTPNEKATEDYITCFKGLHDYVDYFVVNVSSPNTPNLRALQEKEPLTKLLTTLRTLNDTYFKPKPILLKIAPDLTDGQLDDIIEIVQNTGISGIVATNTTIERSNLKSSKEAIDAIGNGGLSGQPLKDRATAVIRYITQNTGGKIPIIAVGGIFTAQDAKEKLDAGAALVQVYTGFIYEGPKMAKNICSGLKD